MQETHPPRQCTYRSVRAPRGGGGGGGGAELSSASSRTRTRITFLSVYWDVTGGSTRGAGKAPLPPYMTELYAALNRLAYFGDSPAVSAAEPAKGIPVGARP